MKFSSYVCVFLQVLEIELLSVPPIYLDIQNPNKIKYTEFIKLL